MADKIRWGILGAAKIGRKVIPAIQAAHNSEVVAVASRSLEKAETYAKELSIPKAYGSYEALLAAPDIDAIYIPLPNSEHVPWSIKCAEEGKHTLCEKPLAIDADEAQTAVDVFAEKKLKFAEAFMYRHHPHIRRIREIIAEGGIGEVKIIHSAFTFQIGNEDNIRLSDNLAGGGLMDVGCYPVSFARLIAGEPLRAAAFANFGKDSGVDETLTGILECPNGVLMHFDCSLRTFYESSIEVRGSHGKIALEKAFNTAPDIDSVIHWWSDKSGSLEYTTETIPATNHYRLMAEDFADAILNDHEPAYPAQDAVANMRVIDQLLASARANR